MGVRYFSNDVDSVLYKILNSSAEVTGSISGKIYKGGFRPTNSSKEDISINTIACTQDNPQIAVSNINIYVKDLELNINNLQQYAPHSKRLDELGKLCKKALDEAITLPEYKLISFRVTSQKDFQNQDVEIREHFQNLKIELIINNE